MLFARFVLVIALITARKCIAEPTVQTPLGLIKGFVKTSHGGRNFSVFEGIPYAKPPIDNLRFEPPQPIEPWHEVLDAKYPTICAQKPLAVDQNVIGTENCLHINVYVPRETPRQNDSFDVIVHIHGGAFIMGHGNLYCRPDYVMDRDVIFITFNYRLGILGFLSTEDDVVSGNNGLKDQVMALKWVQANIASFGGNPKSITLNGMSAGASSVHFHYFSALSKGLFNRGFSQSGVATTPWSIQREPLRNAVKLAVAVGCSTNSTRVMVDCMKEQPYRELLDKLPILLQYMFLPFAPLAPVIEKGSKPFLKDHPYNLLRKREVLDVPWIVSDVSHEGIFPAYLLRPYLNAIDQQWDTLAPMLLEFNSTFPKHLCQKIKKFYFNEMPICEKTMANFVKMFSDRLFLVDAQKAMLLQAEANRSPVYYQWFAYPGDNAKPEDVGHGYDAKFYYGNVTAGSKPLTKNELQMTHIVWELLVSYTNTNTPQLKGIKWEPIRNSSLTYLNISGIQTDEIRLQKTKEIAPVKFWDSLEL